MPVLDVYLAAAYIKKLANYCRIYILVNLKTQKNFHCNSATCKNGKVPSWGCDKPRDLPAGSHSMEELSSEPLFDSELMNTILKSFPSGTIRLSSDIIMSVLNGKFSSFFKRSFVCLSIVLVFLEYFFVYWRIKL